MRRGLSDAMTSTAAYRAGLGPDLEHVLAARLSERHGVSLYGQPEAGPEHLLRQRPGRRPVGVGRPRPPTAGRGRRPGDPAEDARPPGAEIGANMNGPVRSPNETAQLCTAVLDEIERAVVGRRRSLELVLVGILAAGHILLEDLPGLGKTLIARSFATVLGLDFARIQFTPDMLPSDVVGAPFYNQRSGEMVFRPGPVFTNLLLADEINRTPPKTQAALLEAMGEGQVSSDGGPGGSLSPSSSWPPTTRSSTRGPMSCPRPSWTVLSCGCASGISTPTTRSTWCNAGSTGARKT